MVFLSLWHIKNLYSQLYLKSTPLTVTKEELTISNVPLVGSSTRAAYRFTDLYGSHCWTRAIPTY